MKFNELMEDLIVAESLVCLDPQCGELAELSQAYNNIAIRECKNGHRTGYLID